MGRIGALLGMTALFAAILTGTHASADTGQVISGGTVSPSSIKLYATGSTSITVEARITGQAPLLVSLAYGTPGLTGEECTVADTGRQMALVSGTSTDGVWRGKAPIDDGYAPGTYSVAVLVYNYDGSSVTLSSRATVGKIQVRRNAYLTSVNAGPEPVRKNKPITVTGILKRLACKSAPQGPPGKYVPYGGRTVTIQFRALGTKTFQTLATVRTGSNGRFTKKFTARQGGTWRAVYAGSSYYVPSTSAGDYVSVR